LDESRKSITRFARLDSRARESVGESQMLMASDVIFAEGRELLSATASHLDQAREHQRQARDRRNADARRLEMYTIAATGGLALLIMLLLVPAGRREAESEAADATARVVIRPDLTLRTAPPTRLPSSGPEVSLKDASALSLDLARVSTPSELRALLERASNLLHARGLVLWVPGASGDLRPGLSHGYSEALLAKMPGIAPTADNATAAAYRLGEVREVPAGNSPTGAVIAPLLTPAGCAGVLAVELPAGAESHTAVQAIVTFLAGQLAGTVTVSKPDEGRASSDARSARASS
ncbi:MAG: hypothetical protein HY654_04160, partial [Acidobacteria bacterium]|nr:hypothetical protein [Acidobacteriota bacterium]